MNEIALLSAFIQSFFISNIHQAHNDVASPSRLLSITCD